MSVAKSPGYHADAGKHQHTAQEPEIPGIKME